MLHSHLTSSCNHLAALAVGLSIAACSGPEADDWAQNVSGVAPVGSAATLVSHTVPATMAPGERYPVSVTYDNTGAASPANDWDSDYRITNTAGGFFWGYTRVLGGPVATGNSHTFRFVITAPDSGSRDFGARIYTDTAGETGFFGDTVGVSNVTVDPAQLPQYGCALVSSTLPATMNPGEVRSVDITVRNVGSQAWTAGQYCLYSRDSPVARWGSSTCVNLTENVAAAQPGLPATGGTTTFTFNISAPTTPGTTPFRRQMFDFTPASSGGVAFFNNVSHCVDTSIDVAAAAPPYDASFDAGLSNHDDAAMGTWAPSERRRVTIRLDNTGTNDWLDDGDFRLFSRNSPFGLWGPVTSNGVDTVTAQGSGFTHSFFLTAPATPGAYDSNWQMWSSRATPNYFGPVVAQAMTVSAGAQRQFDATVVSQTVPTIMGPYESANFIVRLRNTGWDSWFGSDFRLTSQNSPEALWGVSAVPLGGAQTVAPNEEVEFVIAVTSPPNEGTYDSRWQMGLQSGGFNFGALASSTVVVQIGCGNGISEGARGEECDDGNVQAGDGCSATCQIEPRTLDLATQTADRTLFGRESARDLSNVAWGDFNNDGSPDLVAGTVATVRPTGLGGRPLGGAAFVVFGGNFFTGGTTQIQAAAGLEVMGERSHDQLAGGLYGSVVVADVTGPGGAADGIDDLIVSSGVGACIGGSGDCGRIYVIRGGNDFPTGQLDLANPPAQVVATLSGSVVDAGAMVLTAGDLTGDGTDDLVIGLPGQVGGDGRVVVVAGGVTLTGDRALSGGTLAADVAAAGAGDQLGFIATVGDVSGDGQADLLVSTAAHDPLARDRAGGAWAIFGPLSGLVDLAGGDYDVRWMGAGIRDKLGSALAVGDVAGTTDADVLVGVVGARFENNNRFGSVDVYVGPFVTGTTFDRAIDAPGAVIRGREVGGEMGRVARLADMNGDGILDIIAAGSFQSGLAQNLTQAGELAVVVGGPGLASVQPAPGASPLFITGVSVGRMGLWPRTLAVADVDLDGRADLCVASPDGSVPASGLVQEGRIDCYRSRW